MDLPQSTPEPDILWLSRPVWTAFIQKALQRKIEVSVGIQRIVRDLSEAEEAVALVPSESLP
jgi:hypothetical protein